MNAGSQSRTSFQTVSVDSSTAQARPTQPDSATVVLPQPQQQKAWAHERSPNGKDEWLTPPWLIQQLGNFDLDPCAPVQPPWPTAARHYSIMDDGLTAPWSGRIWMNPPYGRSTGPWMRRLVQHGDGIALIFARTETKMFFDYVWGAAEAVLFLRGRLKFYHVDGTPAANTAGAPSCLVAYGARNVAALQSNCCFGKLVNLRSASLLINTDNQNMPLTIRNSALVPDTTDSAAAQISAYKPKNQYESNKNKNHRSWAPVS